VRIFRAASGEFRTLIRIAKVAIVVDFRQRCCVLFSSSDAVPRHHTAGFRVDALRPRATALNSVVGRFSAATSVALPVPRNVRDRQVVQRHREWQDLQRARSVTDRDLNAETADAVSAIGVILI
jgi:hypothetical protein